MECPLVERLVQSAVKGVRYDEGKTRARGITILGVPVADFAVGIKTFIQPGVLALIIAEDAVVPVVPHFVHDDRLEGLLAVATNGDHGDIGVLHAAAGGQVAGDGAHMVVGVGAVPRAVPGCGIVQVFGGILPQVGELGQEERP